MNMACQSLVEVVGDRFALVKRRVRWSDDADTVILATAGGRFKVPGG